MRIVSANITGSVIVNGVDVTDALTSTSENSGSISQKLDSLQSSTSSLNSFTSSINTTIKNYIDSETVISGSVQVLITGTTGYSDFSSSISTSIGSLSSSVATTTYDLSSSIDSLSGSIATTTSNLSSSIGNLSSSAATTTSGLAGRITTIEGNYATTGSNIFVGSQVITGSLYITTDLIVQGSSSLQNITASAVSIGTNTVILNTDTPAVRFAGISVQDSGSNAGVTGSIYWDGLCNRWVYSNPTGVGYSGGMLLSGPRTSTLGSEAPLTCNYIAKSGGGDHLYDSCIYEISGSVGINCSSPGFNLDINGELGFNSNISSGPAPAITATQNGTGYLFVGKNGASNKFRVGPSGYVIVDENSNNVGLTINQAGSGYSAVFCGGNVGINCSSPNYKLHVNGCTSIDGNLRMGSGYSSGNSTDPGITVQGYSNAGIYFANCGVGLGGGSASNLLFLSNAGNVSIGTESAYGKLSVVSSDHTVLSSVVWGGSNSGGIHATIYNVSQCVNSLAGLKLITRNSGASHWSMYNISTGPSAGDLIFGHGSGGSGCEMLRIVSGGNVGINNTTPCGKLQITLGTVSGGCFRTSAGGEAALTIEACSNSYIQFMNCSNGQTGLMFGNNCVQYSGMIWYRHNHKQLMLGAGGTETMYVCGGNVGIGTSSPTTKLEIKGTNTYHKIATCFSGDYSSGFALSDYLGGIIYDAGANTFCIYSNFANYGGIILSTATNPRLFLNNTGIACFSCKPSFPGASLTCTYTCTYSSYTAGCWLGLFAGDNGFNGAYAFTVVGQFNLGGSGLYSMNYSTVPYIHKSDSIGSTNSNDFYGVAHTSSGHADNGALVCFRRVRYNGNTPAGNRTEFCMNVSYSNSFTATTYVLAWV